MIQMCLFITAVLVILKLSGAITISWAWATCTIWFPTVLLLIIAWFRLAIKNMEDV